MFYPDAPDAMIVAGGYAQLNFIPDPCFHGHLNIRLRLEFVETDSSWMFAEHALGSATPLLMRMASAC